MKEIKKRAAIRVGLLALLGGVLVFSLYKSGLHFVTVNGNSMYPTLKDGDRVTTLPPKDEDSLKGYPVCWVRLDSGEDVIKRLIGMPGQTVHLIDGDTYVDGRLIMERTTASWDNMIVSLGVDEYFFLGDNREDSLDGRMWSPHTVHFSNIRGVVDNSQLF